MKIQKIQKSKTQNSDRGQSMFEVVLALFIMAMIIIGVVFLSTNSISNSLFSRNKTLASRYSQEAVEWLRSEREKDVSLFITRSGTYCLDGLSWSKNRNCNATEIITSTILKRELILSKLIISNQNIINATVVTSWIDSKGAHSARSVTSFSDIREK